MTLTLIAMGLLWIGAAGFAVLVLLRGRWKLAAGQGRPVPAAATRKAVEAGLIFAGTGSLLLGLGLLGLSAVG